jgi:glycerol-3-phosphate dehydrogenase (NAD(P)+)
MRIGVIGGGAWGTALAQVLSVSGKDVILWAREPEVVESIRNQRENTSYLPGIQLSETIEVTDSLTKAAEADILLMVTPAQYLRSTLMAIKGETDGKPVVLCSKGIELQSGLMLSQIAEEEVPKAHIAVLTGPTFASEIAKGLPSAVTIAAKDKDVAAELVENLGCRTLRPYMTDDLIGTQIGGAIKNVMAIACGIVAGKQLGDSARAALLTRGISEMSRLASAMGAKKTTLMGMCGIGDLMLTASSMQSRNYSLGYMLGEGRSLQEIMDERKSVTEGVHTANALKTLANAHAVEMPIADTVYDILHKGISVDEAIDSLLSRPFTPTV